MVDFTCLPARLCLFRRKLRLCPAVDTLLISSVPENLPKAQLKEHADRETPK